MNKILILAFMLTGLNAMAHNHEGGHQGFDSMIEFNTGGFGADYSTSTIDANGTDVDAKTLELKLNYAHRVSHNFWVQGILAYEGINTESPGSDEDETNVSLTIAAVYNLDHDATNSFYGKIGYQFLMVSEDDNTNNTTADIDLGVFAIELGKRWSLEKFTGIKNISYVASISYGVGSGDFDNGTSTDIDFNGLVIKPLGIALFF